ARVWPRGGHLPPPTPSVTRTKGPPCHSAGGTFIQYDMTIPAADDKLVNISPYGTWRSSPMGLAGRDPVFFAQLASETQTFHPQSSARLQDTCLGCHGIQGQRQSAID